MHQPHSKHEPENTPWKRASFDVLKVPRDWTLRTSCEENAAALTAFFDGESADKETQLAARHLEECARCRELLRGWQHARDLLLSTPPTVAPPLLLPRVLAAWRLVALRDSLKNNAPSAAAPPESAPPPDFARTILRATSAAPSQAVADFTPSHFATARTATTRRAAPRVLALAVPACLLLAAFSLQPNAPEETLPNAIFSLRSRAPRPLQVASAFAKPELKSETPAPAKIAIASTRNDAPAISQSMSSRDAMEKATPAKTEIAAPTPAHIASVNDSEPSRDTAPRAAKIAFGHATAPRFEMVKLSAITEKFATLTLSRNATNPGAPATMRAPQSTKIAMTPKRVPTFSRRAVVATPRLTVGAPVAAARAQLTTVRLASLSVGWSRAIAPLVTRPDAALRIENGLAGADFRAVRSSSSAPARAASSVMPRLAYAAPVSDGAADDTLDEMRAATNSYRAALDAETDGSDGNI